MASFDFASASHPMDVYRETIAYYATTVVASAGGKESLGLLGEVIRDMAKSEVYVHQQHGSSFSAKTGWKRLRTVTATVTKRGPLKPTVVEW